MRRRLEIKAEAGADATVCYLALGLHGPTSGDAPLQWVGSRLRGAEKKPPAFNACGIQGHISMGACLRPCSCYLGNPRRVSYLELVLPETTQSSPWEAMQRNLACSELCIQILRIITVGGGVGEVSVSCKGPDCTPHPHSRGEGKGTVEGRPPGPCAAGQGMQGGAW